MKRTYIILLIIGAIIIGLLIYAFSGSNNSTSNTSKITKQQSKSSNSQPQQTTSQIDEDENKTPQTPKADVATKFNLGTGNFEAKTVSAKKGQQVSLGFEASFEDEVRIDEYGIKNIYILPLSEQSIQFAADKTGEFRIYLVKRNKTIGTLIVK